MPPWDSCESHGAPSSLGGSSFRVPFWDGFVGLLRGDPVHLEEPRFENPRHPPPTTPEYNAAVPVNMVDEGGLLCPGCVHRPFEILSMLRGSL